MKTLLPRIAERNQYRELFKLESPWVSAIEFLIHKHQLVGPVKRGALGSHIVYRVGDSWIKMMAPLFAKDMTFETSGLKTIEGRLSVRSPQILAEGVLEGWPYVVLDDIDGEPLRSVWSKLHQAQKENLAGQVAKIIKEIRQCEADDVIKSRFLWDDFIQQQYEQCEDQQRKKGLSNMWLKDVGRFLRRFDISEFRTHQLVFLHADLTYDHFLMTQAPEPNIIGIIDMADCQVGHFEYELVAPCVFLFKGNQSLLRHFLIQSGYKPKHLDQRFSEKLLAWSILHRYFSMISYFQDEMNQCQPGDFSALASKVFPLTEASYE